MEQNDMILEVNKNDAMINTRQIPNYKNYFIKTLSGILVGFVLFSGSKVGLNKALAEQEVPTFDQTQTYIDENQIVDIPEEVKSDIASFCNKQVFDQITIKDLQSIDTREIMMIDINSSFSLEWMNYLGHVKNLYLQINHFDQEMFKQIESLQNVKNLTFLKVIVRAELVFKKGIP